LYKQCIPYLSGIFSKLCSNKKKGHYGSNATSWAKELGAIALPTFKN
jgi:hypothetical protein